MTQIDDIYKQLIKTVLMRGYTSTGDIRAHYADGQPAHTVYLPDAVSVMFTPEMGLPIITTKPVATKSMLAELDWIWRKMSNNVEELRQAGSTIWDEWEKPDGTIGPAYGAQLRKPVRTVPDRDMKLNQVEYVIHELMNNPRSRRIMTTLYDVDDLDEMALEPCVFLTNWQVDDKNKLHLNVVQRSADLALGVPFNWAQYGVLHRRMAQVLGYELGNMSWTIFNTHVYLRHKDLLLQQIHDVSQDEPVGLILPPVSGTPYVEFFGVPLTTAQVTNYHPNEGDKKPSERTYRYEVAI